MGNILGYLNAMFASCLVWITSLFKASGALPVFLSSFVVYQVVRILVAPIIGAKMSDTIDDMENGKTRRDRASRERFRKIVRQERRGRKFK